MKFPFSLTGNKRAGVILLVALAALGMVTAVTIAKKTGSFGMTSGSFYYCPMHPTYTADRQGECPICGMALVKGERQKMSSAAHEGPHGTEGGHDMSGQSTVEGYAPVMLTPEKQQLIGVRLATVRPQAAAKTIRTAGHIAYDPELYQAEEEYLQSIEAWKKAQEGGDDAIAGRAEKLVESSRVKLELLGLNDELVQELVERGASDKSLLVAQPGESVWMYAPVYEEDLDAVKVGQTVRVTASKTAPGKTYEGKIRAIDPVLDPKTRSVNMRVQLENPDGILKPNVYVDAEVEVEYGRQLLIPETAVLDSGDRQIAFVAKGEGMFEPRRLKLGTKTGDAYVVLEGVSAGERVVEQAAFFLDSESRLQSAFSSSGKAPAGGHQH